MHEELSDDELHIWRASLDVGVTEADRLAALLSHDERARAERFHFERDRVRYIAGRAQLRLLLAQYTGVQPDAVRFTYGENNKPRLADGGPEFNLSHSGGTVLYALSAQIELGIDIELDNPTFAGERIPEHFFSQAEVESLRSLPAENQPRAFLECWTRKEAFIKARGDGLTLALDTFTVTLGPDQPVALMRTAWSEAEPGRWSVLDVSDPAGEYIAAVAARTPRWAVVDHRVFEINVYGKAGSKED
jgi:4'-phosphopantetheinyl transferase